MKVKRGDAAGSAARTTLASAVLVAAAAFAACPTGPSSAQQLSPPSKKSSSSPSSSSLTSSPSKNSSSSLPSSSSSSESLFGPGPEGSRNLVVVGRYLAADDNAAAPGGRVSRARRRAPARGGSTRSRAPRSCSARRVNASPRGARAAPEGIGFTAVFDTKLGRNVRVYDGAAFRRVLDDVPPAAEGPLAELRERALAGALRARFPLPGVTLVSKWEETVAWLAFAESVRSARVAEGVSRRLERAAPDLARLLLAAGKVDDLTALARRLTDASQRLEALEPDPAKARRLRAAARAVRRLRGSGAAPFPQEVRLARGPASAVVRIEGEIGDLALVVASRPGTPRDAAFRRVLHAPLLPVPGSLALTADGKAATWLEAETPTRLARVAVALDGSGPVAVTGRGTRAGSSSARRPSRPPRRTGRSGN